MQDSFTLIVQKLVQKIYFILYKLCLTFKNDGWCKWDFARFFVVFSHLQKKAGNTFYFVCVFRETGACLSPAVQGRLLGPGAQPVCILQGIPTWLRVCRAVWSLSGVRPLLCSCTCIILASPVETFSFICCCGLYSAPVCCHCWIRCWCACVAGLCVNTQIILCASPVTPSVNHSTTLLPVMAR